MKKINLILKKSLWLIPIFFLYACNDGEIEFERIDFTESKVESCTSETATNFLYKLQGKQALILKINQNTLVNKEGIISGDIPSKFQLLFRSFDGNVTRNYFCSGFPQVEPKVIAEISATGGSVEIKTIISEENGVKKYNHLISIKDLVLVNSKGQKLIDSKFDFGTFVTRN